MKGKKNTKIRKQEAQPTQAHLSLMAIQEKLGMFNAKQKAKDADYLKDKPLGLI